MTRTKEPTVKNLVVILVLVALIALMAASGASARMWHHKPAHQTLVNQASKAALNKIERRSYRSLM